MDFFNGKNGRKRECHCPVKCIYIYTPRRSTETVFHSVCMYRRMRDQIHWYIYEFWDRYHQNTIRIPSEYHQNTIRIICKKTVRWQIICIMHINFRSSIPHKHYMHHEYRPIQCLSWWLRFVCSFRVQQNGSTKKKAHGWAPAKVFGRAHRSSVHKVYTQS